MEMYRCTHAVTDWTPLWLGFSDAGWSLVCNGILANHRAALLPSQTMAAIAPATSMLMHQL